MFSKKLGKKRILFFIGTLQTGGGERVVSILSRYMKENGYNVELLLYHTKDVFYNIHPEINIVTVEGATKSKNILKNILWMRKFFRKNADVVVSFLAPFNIIALTAHFGLKSKIIVADRNDPRHVPSNPLIRKVRDFLYRFADGIVVQTTRNKSYFSKSIQRKSTVIFNPVDLKERAGAAIATPKKKKIVSVGRLMPQKNQSMLLRAFAAISTEYPEHELYIFGEGPEREPLEKLAVELNISDKVHLPGSVKDVFDRISDAELFVLSSDYEGMPNALIEALCLGLPCISTKVSGADDLIQQDVNGDIVEVGNTQQLIDSMKSLLANETKRHSYAEKAVSLNSKLATDIIIKEWIGYLEELF